MRHLDLQRLRADIKDFDVSRVRGVEGGGAWVALGKHLCGAAADFTLRSCARPHAGQPTAAAAQAGSGGGPAAGAPAAGGPAPLSGVRGLAVATCCHHRCSWRHFVAQREVLELGFSPQEFEVIAWLTGGWPGGPGGGVGPGCRERTAHGSCAALHSRVLARQQHWGLRVACLEPG
jgi:tRNA:m4X modification enzyme